MLAAALLTTLLTQTTPPGSEVNNLPDGQALILFLVLTLVLALALLWNRANYQLPVIHAHAQAVPGQAQPDPPGHLTAGATTHDDLTIIEGIGPKTAAIFQSAGITTYARLAATDPQELDRILDEAGLRLGNPATWPEQARLAASGNWGALKALQDSLKGGRRL